MRASSRQWWVPAGVVLLSLVPVLAGAVRLTELAGDPEVAVANARFVASPVPVVVHIVSATLYSLLGAFQFVPRIRRHRPRWHRLAGRVLVPAGLLAALSGLWMTLAYARPPADDVLLTPMRLFFGAAMAACLVLGVLAIVRRDVPAHRAWMARGYAIGLGAGTQVLTHLPFVLAGAEPGGLGRVLAMLAGWVVNLAVVEWALRRRPAAARPTPARAPAGPVPVAGRPR
ncbi:DUF2306 domain-containing protein [uncultured Modestobacter sp.]|uniref:DUF2306 domain-containing protein n=1 Tax=uncultured Modestobacter sp. TaxID=380048 RepID=UPI002631203C|nr:DUF2306 domain-containing protein [uncultured Modestobacter sp.]